MLLAHGGTDPEMGLLNSPEPALSTASSASTRSGLAGRPGTTGTQGVGQQGVTRPALPITSPDIKRSMRVCEKKPCSPAEPRGKRRGVSMVTTAKENV